MVLWTPHQRPGCIKSQAQTTAATPSPLQRNLLLFILSRYEGRSRFSSFSGLNRLFMLDSKQDIRPCLQTLIPPAVSDIMTCSIVITRHSQRQSSSYGMYCVAAHVRSEFLAFLAQAGRCSSAWPKVKTQFSGSLNGSPMLSIAGVSDPGLLAMPTKHES